MSDFKKFNWFIFIITFARSMIEIFIPIYLFKSGFEFKSILIFYLVFSVVSLITTIILSLISNKIKYKYIIFSSAIFFLLVYVLINNLSLTMNWLIALAFCYGLYRRIFWVSKRYYTINCISKDESGMSTAVINAVGKLSGMTASICGSILLDNKNTVLLAGISFALYMLAILFLLGIKENKQDKITVNSLKENLKQIPKQNLVIQFIYEAYSYTYWLFPLYLYNRIQGSYSFVGLTNFFVGLSGVLVMILFAKKMDHDKKDYLSILTILVSLTLMVKLHVTSPRLMMIVSLVEGYLLQLHNTSYNRNLWYTGKNFSVNNYNVIIDILLNIGRIFFVSLFLIFKMNLYSVLLFTILIYSCISWFKFDDGEGGYE